MSQKTYDGQTAKFIATVIQNLPPDLPTAVMQEWIQNPKGLQKVLRSVLGTPLPELAVWKTLTIGGKPRDTLIEEFEKKSFKIGDRAKDMMKQDGFATLPEPKEIDLVLLTVAELGFDRGGTTKQIWYRATKELGLELCPAEVGPHLRLAYGDQPKDEWIWIAMEQIVVSDGCPCVFRVDRDDGERWLDDDDARPESRWAPCSRIAFVRPRK